MLFKGGRYPWTIPATNPRTNIQDNRGSRRSWEGQSFPVQPIWCHLRTSRLPSGGRFLWRVVRTVLWGVGELFSFSVRLDTDAFVCPFRGSVLSLMSWCNGAGKSIHTQREPSRFLVSPIHKTKICLNFAFKISITCFRLLN